MKQFPLVQVGNPTFRQPCSEYSLKEMQTKEVKELVKRMKYTMQAVHGVGLAGPQVGVQKQVFVLRLVPTKYRPKLKRVRPYAVFNPEIVSFSKSTYEDWEGCFSVAQAGLFAKVKRPSSIKVAYVDENGERIERNLHDLEARIFQHEYDHIIGKVFMDRDVNAASYMGAEEYKLMRQQQAA